ncbi:biogenesis of lysosome-related organelles complex 1 subunit 4-like [Sabethes cyaneus]|uniref:biogenesis of lysosome-related organelles complex 1 subunit 4-like n=1 Tax=Sabethes cyaneus TaxID=53552 RepID=UPI00237EE366|nr:biogenesis of lysosome-related organelles complex 1 subunit 4-like [Sabethes cyaneus]
MAEEPLKDYSCYYRASNLQTEILPISARIDEMLLRMEEFENLLELIKEESLATSQQNIPRILQLKPELDSLCERLDQLEKFVVIVTKNLDSVERQVQIAEEELDIPDKTINVLLKSLNIFGKSKPAERQTNRNPSSGMYEAPIIFKTENYFGNRNTTEESSDGENAEK